MKETSKKMGRPETGKTPQRQIRATDEQWAAWFAAAERAGVSRSEWMRQVLDRAAKRTK